jgi:hypothetical protein
VTSAQQWLAEVAALWAGGQEDRCVFGHTEHVTVDAALNDGTTFRVFDEERYRTETPGFCEGRDEVSKAILCNGWWEAPGTKLWTDALRPGDIAIDIGAHVGWYAMHARRKGASVLVVDASMEHLDVLAVNAHPIPGTWDCRGWIGENTPPCPLPPEGVRVRAVKIDIEGNERHAIAALWPLLERGLVDHLLVEVSPVFTGLSHACRLVDRILDADYLCRSIDGKVIKNYEDGSGSDSDLVLPQQPQWDLLFTKEGL